MQARSAYGRPLRVLGSPDPPLREKDVSVSFTMGHSKTEKKKILEQRIKQKEEIKKVQEEQEN